MKLATPVIVTIFIALIAVSFAGIAVYYLTMRGEPNSSMVSIASFEDCVAAGYPVMESYPRQCAVPGGRTFTEDIGNELEKQELIRIDLPRPNQEISSPLAISGQAVGTWFFEASFPVVLLDGDGNEIASTVAQAQGDWMTTEFVPFSATLTFPESAIGFGTLVLRKDNPSGLAENEDALRVPVVFSE